MSQVSLADICSELHSGKGIPAAKISETGAYPVMGGNGLRGYTNTFNFEGECAVIGRQGAACGNVRYFSGKAYMTEHAVIARAGEGHNSRYLAYMLSRENLGRLSGQSAQPGLSVKTLAKQVYDMPSRDEQDSIASYLSLIDEKIALNQQINGYLAELAEAEFLHRFGHCEDREDLGVTVRISTKSLKPQDCIGEIWEHYSIPAYDESRRAVFEPASGIKSNKYVVDDDSILISKLNPSIKRIWWPLCMSEKAVCSTEFIVYRPKDPSHKSFYYAAIDDPAFSDFLLAHVTGSTGSRQRVQPKATLAYQVAAPGRDAIDSFCNFANPIYQQIRDNTIESWRLEQLRDALLPKLMSGEIDVSCIELPTLLNSHLSAD